MADEVERLRKFPCNQEKMDSLRCLDQNNYDHGRCGAYFEAYRNCKKKWGEDKARARKKMREEQPTVLERLFFGSGKGKSDADATSTGSTSSDASASAADAGKKA
eukprot:m.61220 g.61220  ORF g.61220 m.61220 type:complete len:105 (-) comp7328_c0_seq3:116-430(-)